MRPINFSEASMQQSLHLRILTITSKGFIMGPLRVKNNTLIQRVWLWFRASGVWQLNWLGGGDGEICDGVTEDSRHPDALCSGLPPCAPVSVSVSVSLRARSA